jgi:hypothetical protein
VPAACATSNTDIGTLTRVAKGNAPFDINAVLSCTVIGTANGAGPTHSQVERVPASPDS